MFRSASTCLLLLAASPALALPGGNAFHIGKDIVIPAGQTADNTVCILCSIQADGAVEGSMVVVAGNIFLDGPVQSDAIVMGGRVTMTGKASIHHNLVVFGGKLFQAAGASIEGRTIVVSPIVFLPILGFLIVMIGLLALLLRHLLIREAAPFPPLPRF